MSRLGFRLAALDAADIVAVKPGALGQVLLAEAEFGPPRTDPPIGEAGVNRPSLAVVMNGFISELPSGRHDYAPDVDAFVARRSR